MFGFLIAGVSFGLSAGFSPGPLFAMVISQTMRFGLKEGIKAAFAPLITDLPIIIIATFLLTNIYSYKSLLGLISIAGGVFLTYLAYKNMKIGALDAGIDSEAPDSIVKSAAVNALSPHPYLFWITVGSPMLINAYIQDILSAIVFIVSFYICLIGAKIMLAAVVHKSRGFLQGKTYVYTMKILGLVLFFFALFLFHDGFKMLI